MLRVVEPDVEFLDVFASKNASESHGELTHCGEIRRGAFESVDLGRLTGRQQSARLDTKRRGDDWEIGQPVAGSTARVSVTIVGSSSICVHLWVWHSDETTPLIGHGKNDAMEPDDRAAAEPCPSACPAAGNRGCQHRPYRDCQVRRPRAATGVGRAPDARSRRPTCCPREHVRAGQSPARCGQRDPGNRP